MAERMRVTSFIGEVTLLNVPARARAPSLGSPRDSTWEDGTILLQINRYPCEGIDGPLWLHRVDRVFRLQTRIQPRRPGSPGGPQAPEIPVRSVPARHRDEIRKRPKAQGVRVP